jgi:hypothetical protein
MEKFGYMSAEAERNAYAELDRTRRGFAENRKAREQIDAEIDAQRTESQRKADADAQRRKQAELDAISSALRAQGATDEEARTLAEDFRTKRLLASVARGDDQGMFSAGSEYDPLV